MKIALVAGHQGSFSWQKMIEELSKKYDFFFHLKGLSDDKYRKTGFYNRLRNRVYIFVYYPLKTLLFLTKLSKFDKIIVVPSPFFIPLILCIFFRGRVVIIQTDIYPEGFKSIPFLKNLKTLQKFYRLLSDKFYEENLNLFISKNLMKLRNYPKSKVVYTPSVERTKEIIKTDSKIIGYLGTLGHNHHGLEFLEMLKNSSFEQEINLSFNISGALVESFKKRAVQIRDVRNLKSLSIEGQLDERDFQKKMNSISFGLVMMGKEASNILFPSKFSGHIAAGHPIILISDQKNEIHEFIEDFEIGLSIHHAEDNLNKLNNFLKNENLDKLKKNAISVFQEHFDHQIVANKIFQYVN